jgi:regulator of sigma E protease
MSWVLTIFGIAALVILHEAGHFAVAKATGMRVERFSLFFPPKIVGIRRGETEYMIGAIPFGGYVKITGMSPEELEGGKQLVAGVGALGAAEGAGDEQPEIDPEILRRAYYNQPPWKRIAVILAGPGVNLLIAFLLFWGILFSGSVAGIGTLELLNPSIHTRVPSTTVVAIEKHKPAYGTLRLGDRIVAIDGRHVNETSAIRAIGAHRCAGTPHEGCRAVTPVQLTVRRAGRTVTLSVYPRYSAQLHRMLIGFDFGAAAKSYGPFAAAGTALGEMWGITAHTLTNIGHAFTSAKVRRQFSSIVGITVDTQEAVTAGAGYALVILGFVSLALAIVNLFPFLPLDGGHVLWSLAEKVRGRRVSLAAMWRFSSVGIVLLAFLVINGLSNDITRLGG